MSMRIRVLITVLPAVILPLLLVAFFSISIVKSGMREQNIKLYSNIISQVQANIEYYYNQYAIAMNDIKDFEPFQEIIHHTHAKNFAEQRSMYNRDYGMTRTGRIRQNLVSKVKGDFIILELDRYDWGLNVDYMLTKMTVNDIVLASKDRFLESSVYEEMTNRMNTKPIFCASLAAGFDGYDLYSRPAFFVPLLEEGDSEILKIMGVVETTDFFKVIYEKLTDLQTGTLYITDLFDNILAYNHPSYDDYYDYDEDSGRYVFNKGDPLRDPFTNMFFTDYQLLNTDQTIIQHPEIQTMIQVKGDDETERSVQTKVIKIKGVDYLTFVSTSRLTDSSIIFTKALSQIYRPVAKMTGAIVIIAIIVIIIIVFFSMYISRMYTNPIVSLTNSAKIIQEGDYKHKVNQKGFFGEFGVLGSTFNDMVMQINNYSSNLEELVDQRTIELNQANDNLSQVNSELTAINEKNVKDLLMAQRIQSTFVPKVFPEMKSIRFAGKYQPMEALGGDLYDVYMISPTKVGVLILDVCGHGVPAALITSMAKVSFGSNIKVYDAPEQVVSAVNREICEAIQGSGDYLTAFLAIIDIETMKLTYCNPGHNDMLLVSQDGTLQKMTTNGPVVGVFADMSFSSVEIDLRSGDRLVVYTDGVVEAMNSEKDVYGDERFEHMVIGKRLEQAEAFIEELFYDVNLFKDGMPENDDIAVLVADIL